MVESYLYLYIYMSRYVYNYLLCIYRPINIYIYIYVYLICSYISHKTQINEGKTIENHVPVVTIKSSIGDMVEPFPVLGGSWQSFAQVIGFTFCNFNIDIENGPVEIVSCPSFKLAIIHDVTIYQRVNPIKSH